MTLKTHNAIYGTLTVLALLFLLAAALASWTPRPDPRQQLNTRLETAQNAAYWEYIAWQNSIRNGAPPEEQALLQRMWQQYLDQVNQLRAQGARSRLFVTPEGEIHTGNTYQ